jgi:hypothetical protein
VSLAAEPLHGAHAWLADYGRFREGQPRNHEVGWALTRAV